MYGKNKYSIVLANPANNITVFVLDYIEREDCKTTYNRRRYKTRDDGGRVLWKCV